MNRFTKTAAVTLLAGGVALGAADTASAKPAICSDISVPVKVRLAEGCFLPDSTPALPPGDAAFDPPAPLVVDPGEWVMPAIVVPEAPTAEKGPAEETPTETTEVQ